MVTEMKEFSTIKELMDHLDTKIEDTKNLLEQYMAKLEVQKVKIEKIQALSNSLSKVLGRKPNIGVSQVVDLMGLKLVVNPSPVQEVSQLENLIKALNDQLVVLQKIKKAVESLGMVQDTQLNLSVIFVNDIPTTLMLQLT